MSFYVVTEEAALDLEDIWSYIAEDSESAADRVQLAFYEAFEFLAKHPLSASLRPSRRARAVRYWALPRFSRYLIVYRIDGPSITILRVIHGARDLSAIF